MRTMARPSFANTHQPVPLMVRTRFSVSRFARKACCEAWFEFRWLSQADCDDQRKMIRPNTRTAVDACYRDGIRHEHMINRDHGKGHEHGTGGHDAETPAGIFHPGL